MQSKNRNNNNDYDDLMASLFVLITHHSLNSCGNSLSIIVERLNQISAHPEIELYPNQKLVIAKMHNLWRAKLFSHQNRNRLH